jgi:N-acetylglucosaminyl-diphospho-decaprenol L-rhamnosyltransferase
LPKGDIAYVLGASMIAGRSLVNDLGGFDERFFLYGEDQDLCLSIRKAGWAIGYIHDATVAHWGGAKRTEQFACGSLEDKV